MVRHCGVNDRARVDGYGDSMRLFFPDNLTSSLTDVEFPSLPIRRLDVGAIILGDCSHSGVGNVLTNDKA
jgi:hypothetical protein